MYVSKKKYLSISSHGYESTMSCATDDDDKATKRKRGKGNDDKPFFTFTIPKTEVERLCRQIDNLGETVTFRVGKKDVPTWNTLPDEVQNNIIFRLDMHNFSIVNNWALEMGVIESGSWGDYKTDYYGGWSEQSVNKVKSQLVGTELQKKKYEEAVDNMQKLFKIMFNEGKSESNDMQPSNYYVEHSVGNSEYQGMGPSNDYGVKYNRYNFEVPKKEEQEQILINFVYHFSVAVAFLFDEKFEEVRTTENRRATYVDYKFIQIYLLWMANKASSLEHDEYPMKFHIIAQDALLFFVVKNDSSAFREYATTLHVEQGDVHYMPHPSVAPRKIWPRADKYFNKYAAILESQEWGVSNEKDEKIIRLKTILKLVSESLDWMNSEDEEDAYIDDISDDEDSEYEDEDDEDSEDEDDYDTRRQYPPAKIAAVCHNLVKMVSENLDKNNTPNIPLFKEEKYSFFNRDYNIPLGIFDYFEPAVENKVFQYS